MNATATYHPLNMKETLAASIGAHIVLIGLLYLGLIISQSRPHPYQVTITTDFPARREAPALKVSTVSGGSAATQAAGLNSLLQAAQLKPAHVAQVAETRNSTDAAKNLRSDVLHGGVAGQTQGKLSQTLGLGSVSGPMQWGDVDIQKGSGQLSDLTYAELQEIQKMLSRHFSEFRDCYEKALLSDATLSGFAKFLLGVGGGGAVSRAQIDFDGQGNAKGRSTLNGCLNTVSRRLKFPASVSGRSVSFGVRVKS